MIALSIVMLAAMGAGEPAVMWLNASEIDSEGLDIAEAGVYHVWLWVADEGMASAKVGSQKLEASYDGKKEKDHTYVWLKAGTVDLKAEKVPVVLGDQIAMIALSLEETFCPKASMGDRCVFDTPRTAGDLRVQKVKHTDTVFTMPEFKSVDAWEAVAAKLRKRILLSSGLWPLPEKTPLNAHIFGRIAHDDYTVEKVWFEARPGFLVTGNLYRPMGKGPFPGVANPHGHWKEGRLANEERGSVPGRCITQARMGMVAFSYDMIGYNDSLQFQHNWGGHKEKLWGIHPFAMQLWSSIRVIDFLQSLPDVDPERIACTGASGGGTQTFSLMAVDPRVKAAAPVNMISHSMQGGCLCENAPIIRLDNSNMEIGATMAPRPLLMVSATGDWTRETPRVEFPALRSIYKLYQAEEKVDNVHIDAPHNYNKLSREAVYRFLGKWLLNDPVQWANYAEPSFEIEKEEDLRVFPDKKLPDGLPDSAQIIAKIVESTGAKWQAILPKNKDGAATFHDQYGDALALVLGAAIPESNDLDCERIGFEERKDKGYVVERWLLHRRCVGDAIPAILYRAYDATRQDAVLVVDSAGKAALADIERGGPGPLVAGLIAQGKAVMVIDAFLIGEHHSPLARTERRAAGQFSDTFQPTDTGCRIQDVVTALAYLRSRRDFTGVTDLVGLGDGGVWCLFASALDGNVRKTVVDANGFDVQDDKAWAAKHYIPCIRAIGDVATAAALIAPRPLIVFNATPSWDALADRFKAVQADPLALQKPAPTADALLSALR